MTPTEFLARVLPAGLVVIAKLTDYGFKHAVVEDHDNAARVAIEVDREGSECYFGLGSLKERRVWNKEWNDGEGKWEVRVGHNIDKLKSLFVDIDIDESGQNQKKYSSKGEALEALDHFSATTGFPVPLVVSSGGGLHCYWVFDRAVPAEDWRPLAAAFKSAVIAAGLRIDPARTADASSVLRVVGTHNHKRDTPRPVEVLRDARPYPNKEIFAAVLSLVAQVGSAVPAVAPPASPFDTLGSNLEYADNPADINLIAEKCWQVRHLVETGGESEPIWHHGLQLVRFCTDPEQAALLLSQNYPGYTEAETKQRCYRHKAGNIGPPFCTTLNIDRPGVCDTCPHWGQIKTPLVLGRKALPTVSAAPPEIEVVNEETGETETIVLPNPPYPYTRREQGGIVVTQQTRKGEREDEEDILIYEYDMYPVRRMVSERSDTEQTIWRVQLPLVGWTELLLEQSTLAEPSKLNGLLLDKGVYIHPAKIPMMVVFMVAYISQLQRQAKTDQMFSRLGWRDNNQLFVLDDKLYRRGNIIETHHTSDELKHDMRGLERGGTLEGWRDTIQFYNHSGCEAQRFMLYGSFGAPLFHMTGNLGAIVNAYGETGLGKTTAMEAINSVWGHPTGLMRNGTTHGSTANALQTLLSMHNNIPFCLDEITDMDSKVLRAFALSTSQGTGKIRNVRSGLLSKLIESWATIIFTSANKDTYVMMMQDSRDATAHTMRVFQIRFLRHSHGKEASDRFRYQSLRTHYGHAAHEYVPFIVDKYDKLQDSVRAVVAQTDRKGKALIKERFQSGLIACSIVGGTAARKLNLLPDFPIENDWQWAMDQLSDNRTNIKEHHATSKELLSEFLTARLNETLTLSMTNRGNMPARIDQAPRGSLTVRHELDTGVIYLLKSEFKRYCIETGSNYGAIQEELTATGVLVDHDAKKVLGAGTEMSTGQVRCWLINVQELQK